MPELEQISPEHATAIEAELARLVLGGRGPRRPELMVGFPGLEHRMQNVFHAFAQLGGVGLRAAESLARFSAAFEAMYGRSDQ